MTLKDITVLKSINPITVLNHPSKKTIEYLAKLLQEPEYNNFLKIIHLHGNIPEEGFDIKKYIGKNFFKIPAFNNKLILYSLQNTAHDLSKNVGLSDDFNTQILLLLFFNAFIDVEFFDGYITTPVQFILGKKNITSQLFDYPQDVGAIIIPFSMSKTSLIKWIRDDRNWKNIQDQIDNNLTTNPYLLRLHKNTELALEIVDLKDNKKLTFSKISNLLSDKYPDDDRLKSENGIKKIYYDYKEMWNKLVNKH